MTEPNGIFRHGHTLSPADLDDDDIYRQPVTKEMPEFYSSSGTSLDDTSPIKPEKKVRWKRWCCGFTILLAIVVILSTTLTARNRREESDGYSTTPLSPIVMETLVRKASPTGGKEFDNLSTYQSRALQWVVDNPAPPRQGPYGIGQTQHLFQRFALACIYYATNGVPNSFVKAGRGKGQRIPTWTDERGWLVFPQECDWKGVRCDNNGYVQSLDLSRNNLTGTFPYEAIYLDTSLTALTLNENSFYNSGESQNSFFGGLINLQYLDLSDTLIENQNGIPSFFGRLSNLKALDISNTRYVGRFNANIFANMQQLEYLDISQLPINGTIPDSISKLPALRYLYAINTGLTGGLNFLMGMSRIVEVWLDSNRGLKGTIPTGIGAITTLRSLSFSRCGLTGSVPTELGKLTQLINLWLYDNALTGPIPSQMGNITSLTTFAIEVNKIAGSMPVEICTLTNEGMGQLRYLHADCLNGSSVVCDCCDCCGSTCVQLE